MSSIVDAFNDAFSERISFLKFCIYAIPVYFCLNLFITGQMDLLYFWGGLTCMLLFTLLTQGISNVRVNHKEILSLNPIKLVITFIKSFIAVFPQILVFGIAGHYLTSLISIPIELPHVNLILDIIIWSIVFSIIFTSYLAFAKYMCIKDAFNYKIIFESCVDVFVALLFFIPQLLLANLLVVGPYAYLFWLFHVPFTNWGFVACSSIAVIINISMIANYLAQISYEHVSLSNDKKEDYQITKIIENINSDKGN